MRASARSLTALEIAVRGRDAALSRGQLVFVHAQTHRAAGIAPLKSGLNQDGVEALSLGGRLDLARAGNHQGAHAGGHLAAPGYAGDLADVFDAAVGAGSDKDHVDGLADDGAGLQVHIGQHPLAVRADGFVSYKSRIGDVARHRDHRLGAGAPGDHGRDVAGLQHDLRIEMRAGVRGQGPPVGLRRLEVFTLGRKGTPFDIGEGGLIGRHETGAGAAFDGHVAQGHAASHVERRHGLARIFNHVGGAAAGADLADDIEGQILGGDA